MCRILCHQVENRCGRRLWEVPQGLPREFSGLGPGSAGGVSQSPAPLASPGSAGGHLGRDLRTQLKALADAEIPVRAGQMKLDRLLRMNSVCATSRLVSSQAASSHTRRSAGVSASAPASSIPAGRPPPLCNRSASAVAPRLSASSSARRSTPPFARPRRRTSAWTITKQKCNLPIALWTISTTLGQPAWRPSRHWWKSSEARASIRVVGNVAPRFGCGSGRGSA